jgi:hypothetical protein
MHFADPVAPPEAYLETLIKAQIWHYPWGVILANHSHLHMHIFNDYRKRVFLRKPFREVLSYMFEKYEVLHTQILNKPELLKFELRTGWKIVNKGDLLIDLEMTKKDFKYV